MQSIGIGSKTSTGGVVIEGNEGIMFDGIVASSVGHQATCPRCKKGIGPIVAVGPRTVTLPAGPAARAGDYVACGCPPGSNGLLGASTVLIGGEHTASRTASKLNTAFTLLSSPAGLPQAQAGNAATPEQHEPPHSIEYEEEEEQTAVETQGIILRIGMFFDGTGNNLANAGLTAECRRQDLQEFDEQTLGHIRQLCEAYGYQDTNNDGLYDQSSGGSYGNELSNVALLYRLYEDQADQVVESTASEASIAVYIDGIGTTGGSEDSTWGLAAGQGKTGVVARVGKSPALIITRLRRLLSNNPQLRIDKIEFDIFGFSRGAAAARHFANEVLKPLGGVLNTELNNDLPALAAGFSWSQDACINFIGLFDTVAAIADPLSGNLSVGDSRNPGVNLYLPPGCARKVLHLTAANEHRHNFSLNRVHPSHEELVLPGVHSNLGGGYPVVVRERLLIGRPRLCRATYYSMNNIDRAKLEQSREWRARQAEQKELTDRGLPGQGEFVLENIGLRPSGDSRYRQAGDVLLALGLDRMVRGELARISLRVMHMKGLAHGVPFDVLSEQEDSFRIPASLQPIADKIINAAMIGQNAVLSDEEKRFLHAHYIHCSANWTSTSGLMVNKPRKGNQRAVYEDKPQRGYPV